MVLDPKIKSFDSTQSPTAYTSSTEVSILSFTRIAHLPISHPAIRANSSSALTPVAKITISASTVSSLPKHAFSTCLSPINLVIGVPKTTFMPSLSRYLTKISDMSLSRDLGTI